MPEVDHGRIVIDTHLVRPVLVFALLEHEFVDNYARLRIWREIRA